MTDYRVAVRERFDRLAPKPRREAIARHDLLQTHLGEFTDQR